MQRSLFDTLSRAVPADALRAPMRIPFPFSKSPNFREFYMNSRDFLEDQKGVYTASICFDVRALAYDLKPPTIVVVEEAELSGAAAAENLSEGEKKKEKPSGPVADDPLNERHERIKDKKQVLDALNERVADEHKAIALDLILAGSKQELTAEKLQSYFSSIDSAPPSFAQLLAVLKWQRAYTGKIAMTTQLLDLMHKNPWSKYRTTVTSMPRLVKEMKDSVDGEVLAALGIIMPDTLEEDDLAPFNIMHLSAYQVKTRAAALFWQHANGRKLQDVYNAERASGDCPATWVKKCKEAFAKYIVLVAPNIAEAKSKADLIAALQGEADDDE